MEHISLRQDAPSPHLLQGWFDLLPLSEQGFVRGKLRGLLDLMRFDLNWILIQHLVARWNPDTFSFHFGTLELAPLYEEYGFLSETPPREGLLPLPRTDRPKEYMAKLLRISPVNSNSLFNPQGHISVDALLQLRGTPHLPDTDQGQMSARAFILMFAGTFLYPYKEKTIHARAIYLTKAILEGASFLPNLVGETNYSLTRILQRSREEIRNHAITFSPFLLQAWFYIHLGITGECLRREHYPGIIKRIADRAQFPVHTMPKVRAFFQSLQEEDFYPMARCFDSDVATTSSPDGDFIPIMGLSGTSYYTPARVLHQHGGVPRIASGPARLFPAINLDDPTGSKTHTQRVITRISRVWANLVEEEFAPLPEDPEVIQAQAHRFWKKRITRWED